MHRSCCGVCFEHAWSIYCTGRYGHDLKGDLAVSGLVHLNIGGSIIVGVRHGVCVGEGSEEANGLVHDEGGLFVAAGKMKAPHGGQFWMEKITVPLESVMLA